MFYKVNYKDVSKCRICGAILNSHYYAHYYICKKCHEVDVAITGQIVDSNLG